MFNFIYSKGKNTPSNAKHLGRDELPKKFDYKRKHLAFVCHGGELIKVKPHFTSIECSNCEEKVRKSLSVRTHVCPSCGFIADRDENAAINIKKKGMEQFSIPA